MSPMFFVLVLFELVALAFALSLHDCAQAYAAERLGDPTPRMSGRLTMNPAAHFDPVGSLVWPLLALFLWHSPFVYGWSKRVPMRYRNFRSKNGMMLATAAGPAAQVLAAGVVLVVLIVLKHTVPGVSESMQALVALTRHVDTSTTAIPGIFPVLLLLNMTIMLCLLLAIFNLLPMPFLDGGTILVHFLPYNAAKVFEQYQMIFAIVFFFFAGYIVMPLFLPLFFAAEMLLTRL